MTHCELCDRARQWLTGSARCNFAFAGMGSTVELPDAIGWGSWGSVVVECKCSLSDFYRDKRKKHARRMGMRRYFLVHSQLISAAQVEEHYPDHGLLSLHGKRILTLRHAPLRTDAHLEAEVRFLRFALVHAKQNLLRAGFSVDMNELCKHWIVADMNSALTRPQEHAA